MQLSFDEINKRLLHKDFSATYLLHGEEPYYIDRLTDFFEHKVLDASEKDFNLHIFYGNEISGRQVVDACKQYPMLYDRQVVLVKEAQNMKDTEELIKYVSQPYPTTIFVFAHKHKKVDARTQFGKTMLQCQVVLESKRLYDNQIPDFIATLLRSKKINPTPQATQILSDFLGNDLNKIYNEIEKLVLNIQPNDLLTPEKIEQFIGISKDYNTFELQKAIGNLDIGQAFAIVDYFSKNPKASPFVLTNTALYSLFSKLFMYFSYWREKDDVAAKSLGVREFVLKDYKMYIKNYNPDEVGEILELIALYDLKSKGLHSVNPTEEELLKELVIQIFNIRKKRGLKK